MLLSVIVIMMMIMMILTIIIMNTNKNNVIYKVNCKLGVKIFVGIDNSWGNIQVKVGGRKRVT